MAAAPPYIPAHPPPYASAANVAVPMAMPVAMSNVPCQQQLYPQWPQPNTGMWSTGYWDCTGAVRSPAGEQVGGCCLCCRACCCPCLVFGENSEYMSSAEGATSPGLGHGGMAAFLYCLADWGGHCCIGWPLGCLLHMPDVNGTFRRRYGLPEEPCNDCCAVCCCYTCALVQEHKELKIRGAQPWVLGRPLDCGNMGPVTINTM